MNVWVVTESFNDCEGYDDQFVSVHASYGGAKRAALAAIKLHVVTGFDSSRLKISRSPGFVVYRYQVRHYSDYRWEVVREPLGD